MKRSYVKGLMLGICLLAAGVCYSCGFEPAPEKETGISGSGFVPGTDEDMPLSGENAPEGGESSPETLPEPQDEESPPSEIYVHICGEVRNPGVYLLAEGDRIFRAVELAGGFTELAAQASLNLAQKVTDGMKIEVPSAQEWSSRLAAGLTETAGLAETVGQAEAEGKVDLNTAGREELMTLPGIGRVRADEILRYRQEEGPFQKAEDVMKVPGIKKAVFEKIRDDIVVGQSDR